MKDYKLQTTVFLEVTTIRFVKANGFQEAKAKAEEISQRDVESRFDKCKILNIDTENLIA